MTRRFIYDRIFILQPNQTVPDSVIEDGVNAVNDEAEIEIEVRPSFADVHQTKEGQFFNCGLIPNNPNNELLARFGAAWFTDESGCKHVRVIGDVKKAKSWEPNLMWPVRLPPCTLVYPSSTLENGRCQLTCKCGRRDTLERLRWNGTHCWVCEENKNYEEETGFQLPTTLNRKKS